MLFSSVEFIFVFLPVTLLIYFLCPLRLRNAVLLVVSLVFYGFGEPLYLFLMAATVAADYGFGFLVSKNKNNPKKAKAAVVFAVIFNLFILGLFKYYDFIAVNLAKIPAFSSLRPLGLILPVGISFYTFQALSYVIDVYRRDVPAQKNIVTFGTFITSFPQLVAGPIVRYKDINEQLEHRRHSVGMAADGTRRFIAGLAKKVLLANAAGALFKSFTALPQSDSTVLGSWLGLIFYGFQIYFDFSGYTDMAIGLGKIFGLDFPENFNYPYTAESITDFWRRWHMTLSQWFRDYVYIPLGGNRKGRGRMYFNLFAVWTLTGVWHGAAWNFFLWGFYYFLLLAAEKAFLLEKLKKAPRVLRRVYALFFILLGWLLFVSDGGMLDFSGGLLWLSTMFGTARAAVYDGNFLYELTRNLVFLVLLCVGATPLPKRVYGKMRASRYGGVPADALSFLTLIVCVAYLVNSGYNPFLYFKF